MKRIMVLVAVIGLSVPGVRAEEIRMHEPISATTGLADVCRSEIERNFRSQISIIGLARQFNVSRGTLFRIFQSKFGISPRDYLTTLRLEKAKNLLARTSMAVKAVAVDCGFLTPRHFTQTFQEKYGEPPTHWREKQKTNKPNK